MNLQRKYLKRVKLASASAIALLSVNSFFGIEQKVVHADAVDSDYHVAKAHLTTKDGWSNDLQSIVWNEKGQYYDLYFLHSTRRKYHCISKDGKYYAMERLLTYSSENCR